jgi:putative transcriptional regulator
MSGRKIIDGLHEAISHAKGDGSAARQRIVRVPDKVNVKAIREKLNMSQKEFALRFGFHISSVRNWEQGRRFPEGSARVLLKVIEHSPQTVEDALATA